MTGRGASPTSKSDLETELFAENGEGPLCVLAPLGRRALAPARRFGYVLLGSLSGTTPGIPIGLLVLPLNPDAYLTFTLTSPNTPPLGNSLGLLDAFGEAAASFTIPPGSSPALAGLTLHHAYVVFGPMVVFASNPVPLRLVP